MTADAAPAPQAADGSVAALLAWAGGRLRAGGVETPRRDAQLLLQHVLGCGREALVAAPERRLAPVEAARFRDLVERRAGRQPVSQLIGRREFWSLDLQVGPQVLDPRPDSETVVEALLDAARGRQGALRLLDLGTGSGCLLLALLHELPSARGLGIDASPAALAVARANAERLGLADRTEFRLGDWGRGVRGQFDLVASNPPYLASQEIAGLAPEVRCWEPRLALDGGADGLAAYRRIAADLPRLLAWDGVAAVEVGSTQAPAVEGIFSTAGLEILGRRADLGGVQRCLLFAPGRRTCQSKKTVGNRAASD